MLTQVGKYQIVEKIGVGGFGTVYKGRDPFIKRAVAIKTCQSEDEEIKKRFFREAEFAGNLHHRNVTTIYDFGVTDEGTPYIVQEFLTGEDLDKLIKRADPIKLKRKLRILIDICEGLGYAHAAGILHRDIKPSNVRILDDGTVKIMDFGIAKSMVSQSTLTQTGITLGTASYLAPEQIRGETLDPRTDIFSLGVLAYEFLTGQKPFTGDHISTVLYKIMNETPVRPGESDPAIPRAVDNVVLKALEKERENRHSSCTELRDELSAVSQTIPDTLSSQSLPVSDMDQTMPAPSGGMGTAVREAAARSPQRGVTSATAMTPGSPSRTTPSGGTTPRKSSNMTSSVADVRLRGVDESGVSRSAALPRPREGGGGLRIFAIAVVLLLAAGGAYLYLESQKARKAGPPEEPKAAAAAGTASTIAAPPPVPASAAAATTTQQTAATVSMPADTSTTSAASVVPLAPAAAVPTPIPAPPAASARVAEIATTGTAVFSSNKYARLLVDGKEHKGLPAEVPVKLKPGAHKATFLAMNRPPKDVSFTIAAGQTLQVPRVEFQAGGLLAVKVMADGRPVEGADVTVDGSTFKATEGRKWFPAGTHTVETSLLGYEVDRQVITIPDEDLLSVTVKLKRKS